MVAYRDCFYLKCYYIVSESPHWFSERLVSPSEFSLALFYMNACFIASEGAKYQHCKTKPVFCVYLSLVGVGNHLMEFMPINYKAIDFYVFHHAISQSTKKIRWSDLFLCA